MFPLYKYSPLHTLLITPLLQQLSNWPAGVLLRAWRTLRKNIIRNRIKGSNSYASKEEARMLNYDLTPAD